MRSRPTSLLLALALSVSAGAQSPVIGMPATGGTVTTPATPKLLKGAGSANSVSAAVPGTDYNVPSDGVFYISDYVANGTHTQYDVARQVADAYAVANPSTGSLLNLGSGIYPTCDAAPLPVSASGFGTTSIRGAGVNVTSIQKKTGCTASSATLSHPDALGPLSRGIYADFTVDANHIDTAACHIYGYQLTTLDHVACGNAAVGGDHEWEIGNNDASNVGWADNIYGYQLQAFDTVGTGKGGILTPVWSGTALSSLTLTSAGTKNYSQYVRASLIGPGVALCTTVPTLTPTAASTASATFANVGTVNYGALTGATVTLAGNCSSGAQTAGIYVLVQDGVSPTYGFKMSNTADSHFFNMEATGSNTYAEYWSSHSANNEAFGEHPYTNATVGVYDAGPGNRHSNPELDGVGQYGFMILSTTGVIDNPMFLWDSTTSYIGATAFFFANSAPSYIDYQVRGAECSSVTPNFLLAAFTAASVPAGVHLDNSSTCLGTTGHIDKYAFQNTMSREGVNLYTDTINSANEIQHSATNSGNAIARTDTYINNHVPTSQADEQPSPIQRFSTQCFVSGAAGSMQYSLQLVPQTATAGQAILTDSFGGNCSFARFANYNQFQGSGNGIYFGSINGFNTGIHGDSTTGDLKMRANGSDSFSVSATDGSPYTMFSWYGDVISAHLLAVATPTVANVGTAGSTSYTYAVTALTLDGGETLIGTTAATATGNATLSGTNFNTVKAPFVRGAFTYNVYRHANGGGLTNGLIGTLTYAQQASNTVLQDTGQAPSVTTEPSADSTGCIGVRNNSSDLSKFSSICQPNNLAANQKISLGTTNNGFIDPVATETVASSATPAFSGTTVMSVTTLTASVTSWTMAAGPHDGFRKTLGWCQNSTGGFTTSGTPANVRGFTTAGTTAQKCTFQDFRWVAAFSAWFSTTAGVTNE